MTLTEMHSAMASHRIRNAPSKLAHADEEFSHLQTLRDYRDPPTNKEKRNYSGIELPNELRGKKPR